ncbi:MAG TPA: BofC C-terminal domain-containing protein [Chondromyces sp.]|nr:BofC C-terminal domain-containing protein [Chondromyces sp.]
MPLYIRMLFMAVLVGGALYFALSGGKEPLQKGQGSDENKPPAEEVSTLQTSNLQLADREPHKIKIVLERIYLDGEISQEVKEETVWAMDDVRERYDSWDLVFEDEKQVIFQKKISDISPLLKTNGYFGVTEEGVFSIFNGKPSKSDIIQSFFQIDVRKLESNMKQDLQKGIPIQSKERYQEVLTMFEGYSISQ